MTQTNRTIPTYERRTLAQRVDRDRRERNVWLPTLRMWTLGKLGGALWLIAILATLANELLR